MLAVKTIVVSTDNVSTVSKTRRARKEPELQPTIKIEDFDLKLAERINVPVQDIEFIRNKKDSPEPWHVDKLRGFVLAANLFKIENSHIPAIAVPVSPFIKPLAKYRLEEKELHNEGEQEYPLNHTKLAYDFLFYCLDKNYPVQLVFNQFAKQYLTGANSSDLSKLTPRELIDLTYHLNKKLNYDDALLRIGIALGFTSEAAFKPYLQNGIVTNEMVQKALAKILIINNPRRPTLSKAS